MFVAWNKIDGHKKNFIRAFALGVFGVYVLITVLSAYTMHTNKTRAEANHAARMDPNGVEPGKTAADPVPAQGNFVNVTVGTYIDDVDNFSIKDSFWSTNFYIWFNWKGDKALDPGGKFNLVDGTIVKKELMDDFHGDDGTNYQRYRVNAKVVKFFDAARIPIENHMLNIYVEDGGRDATQLRYVADPSSNRSSRAQIPGYRFTGTSNVVKMHTYKTSYGDPRVAADMHRTFSQYVVALEISRLDYGFYFKIFLSLFAAVLLTLCSFFVKPSDIAPRFALPTGAYFGAVANSYVVNSILPPSGTFGLVDYVVGVGLFTIFISIALSLISCNLYIRLDEKDWSLAFDRVMVFVVGGGCLMANVVIPIFARG